MKSIYVYEFTKVHGPTGYLNTSFFTDKNKQKKFMQRLLLLFPLAEFHQYLAIIGNNPFRGVPACPFSDIQKSIVFF